MGQAGAVVGLHPARRPCRTLEEGRRLVETARHQLHLPFLHHGDAHPPFRKPAFLRQAQRQPGVDERIAEPAFEQVQARAKQVPPACRSRRGGPEQGLGAREGESPGVGATFADRELRVEEQHLEYDRRQRQTSDVEALRSQRLRPLGRPHW